MHKILFARPAAHIQADFRNNPLHRQDIQSGQFGQVGPCNLLKVVTAQCLQAFWG